MLIYLGNSTIVVKRHKMVTLSKPTRLPIESQNANSSFGANKGFVEITCGGNDAGTWVNAIKHGEHIVASTILKYIVFYRGRAMCLPQCC